MRDRPPELDMTIEGRFTSPPRPPIATRILVWAILIAVVAGAISVAAFALWVALIILPVALAAAAIAWVAFRYQVWRARSSIRRQGGARRDIWRP